MKNLIFTLILLLSSVFGFAQERADRMVIHQQGGGFKSYLPERIDSITFPKIEGRIAADAEVLESTLDQLTVKIIRTQNCAGFKLTVLPKVMADRFDNEVALCNYIDNSVTDIYYEDFTAGQLTGITFEPNSNYYFITLGLDDYGTPCSISKAPFTTPKKALVGTPDVTITVTNITLRSFTAAFEPNADTYGYAVLAMEKGSLESQFEMFGPMFGFTNIGDMVKAWGAPFTESNSFTWNDMAPNTDYTIFVQCWDVNETYADLISLDLATLALGGSGEAKVAVTLGAYKLENWNGELLPSQFISYTPNDQASCYRMIVALAAEYNANKDAYLNDLKSDPPMPTNSWFFYEPLTTDYQINPSTEAVVLAAAKNANNEWGPVTELFFTTPASVEGSSIPVKPTQTILKRNTKNTTSFQKGIIPTIKKNQPKLNAR